MSIGNLSRENVLAYLSEANELQLFELFYEAVAKYRETYSEGHLLDCVDQAYVIARGSLKEDGDTLIIAPPDRSGEGYVSDVVVHNGYCDRCKLEQAGFSKRSTCPICLRLVEMT